MGNSGIEKKSILFFFFGYTLSLGMEFITVGRTHIVGGVQPASGPD